MSKRTWLSAVLLLILILLSIIVVISQQGARLESEEQGPFPALAWTYTVIVNGQSVALQYVKVHIAGKGEVATLVYGSEWMYLTLEGIHMDVDGGTYSIGQGNERVSGTYYGGSVTHDLVNGVVSFTKTGISVHFVDQYGTQINWDMSIPQGTPAETLGANI